MMLRQYVSPHALWMQWLPVAIGCVWAIIYFRKHGDEWDWMQHGSLLVLVSIVVAPYTWFMDQAIVIPALLHAAYSTRSRRCIAILALASAAIEIGILGGVPLLKSPFYLWTAPAWLVWYLYAVRATASQPSEAYDPSSLAEGREVTL
jgi:hypothetical protein